MTKQEQARQIVDACAQNPAITSSEMLGEFIGAELRRVAPNDGEMLQYVVDYMVQKAKDHGCGCTDADHNCALNHSNN